MAYLQLLPAPHALDINDSNVAEKWNEWKEMWLHYSVAAKVNKEDGEFQVATFLTAIGPEARKVFKTWNLTATEKKDIDAVIERFDNYCNPRKNVPFEHYRFNLRQQEPGESFDRYVTALRPFLRIDTGARCNVLLVHIYKKAIGDYRLENVNPVKSSIVSYDGGSIPVLGTVKIQVQRGSFMCLLLCCLVESKRCRPILGKSACEGMGVVEIKDLDAIRQPDTSGGEVFSVQDAVSSSKILTKEQVVEMFPDVFDDGLGVLEGEYHIRLDESAKPVKHAPRRGQVALRAKIKETLDELHSSGVIVPVTKPTPWISSMLAVPKKNGKIRICLDPKDLNKAVVHENYPMPTIEDIATHLHGAKVFTVLDAKNGFWHVKLNEESSYLTMFHTPFGRYH